MQIVIMTILGLGWLITIIGGIMFLIAAFRESVWWGLAVLFLPIANFVFLINHWDEAKKAFFVQLGGVGLCIAAFMIGGSLGAESFASQMQKFPMSIPQDAGSGGLTPEKHTIVQEPSVDWAEKTESETKTESVSQSTADWGDSEAKDNFVGMKLKDAENILGKPMAIMKMHNKTIYKYSNIELVSDDGITITSQSQYQSK